MDQGFRRCLLSTRHCMRQHPVIRCNAGGKRWRETRSAWRVKRSIVWIGPFQVKSPEHSGFCCSNFKAHLIHPANLSASIAATASNCNNFPSSVPGSKHVRIMNGLCASALEACKADRSNLFTISMAFRTYASVLLRALQNVYFSQLRR